MKNLLYPIILALVVAFLADVTDFNVNEPELKKHCIYCSLDWPVFQDREHFYHRGPDHLVVPCQADSLRIALYCTAQ